MKVETFKRTFSSLGKRSRPVNQDEGIHIMSAKRENVKELLKTEEPVRAFSSEKQNVNRLVKEFSLGTINEYELKNGLKKNQVNIDSNEVNLHSSSLI